MTKTERLQTSASSVFASGNVVHVNDLVDNVSRESEIAGKYAALYAMGKFPEKTGEVTCLMGENVRYICPQTISLAKNPEKITLYFRVLKPDQKVKLVAKCGEEILASKKEFRVSPGEMCSITIDGSKIKGDVIVSVEKE